MRLRKPSPSGIVAVVALFFALGGTAVAAHHYLITNTSQIKPSVLAKLKGRAGPQGEPGTVGAQGPAGPSNLSGLITVTGPEESAPPEKVKGATATCPAGQHAVSGGGFALFGLGGLNDTQMTNDHLSWFVIGVNLASIEGKITAYVECAGAGQAVAAHSNAAAHAFAVSEAQSVAARLEQQVKTVKP
ncbi:MAG TPA: hypothetical protein VGO14_09225 [Solirubrobacteraceae bacterium]|jgi:hypothetical protein|nr:hypothetical protein [Solirubrobacteraceae bacterium]